jgi:hypothetical protein
MSENTDSPVTVNEPPYHVLSCHTRVSRISHVLMGVLDIPIPGSVLPPVTLSPGTFETALTVSLVVTSPTRTTPPHGIPITSPPPSSSSAPTFSTGSSVPYPPVFSSLTFATTAHRYFLPSTFTTELTKKYTRSRSSKLRTTPTYSYTPTYTYVHSPRDFLPSRVPSPSYHHEPAPRHTTRVTTVTPLFSLLSLTNVV